MKLLEALQRVDRERQLHTVFQFDRLCAAFDVPVDNIDLGVLRTRLRGYWLREEGDQGGRRIGTVAVYLDDTLVGAIERTWSEPEQTDILFVSPVERELVHEFIKSLVVEQPVKYISPDAEISEWWTTDNPQLLSNKISAPGEVDGRKCFLDDVKPGYISVFYPESDSTEIFTDANVFKMRLNID